MRIGIRWQYYELLQMAYKRNGSIATFVVLDSQKQQKQHKTTSMFEKIQLLSLLLLSSFFYHYYYYYQLYSLSNRGH